VCLSTQKETRAGGEAIPPLLPEIDPGGRPELPRSHPFSVGAPLMRIGGSLLKSSRPALLRAAAVLALSRR